jgi:phytoene synthase
MPLCSTDPEEEDLAACRALLRAGSRSFDTASRFLPVRVRGPAVALYAFCRVADDAVDDDPDARAGVAGLRKRLTLAYAGNPMQSPPDRAFSRIVERFMIPRALPDALLEGFAWDAECRRYQDLSALRAYAVRVAGTVGAMMAVLMGVRDAPRLAAAVELGVAMQFSNIARDVGEDARAGRLYLPLDWLAEAGIDPATFLARPAPGPALGVVIRRLLSVADGHYRRAIGGVARLPMACRFGIGAASLLYAEIGREVARRGHDAVSDRAVVSGRRKAWVLASGLAGFALPLRRLPAEPMPEGAFLIDAVTESVIRNAAMPWWDMAERMRWVIDLFERLEQRERVGT